MRREEDVRQKPVVNSVLLTAPATSNFSHVTRDVCFMGLRECFTRDMSAIDSTPNTASNTAVGTHHSATIFGNDRR